MNQPAFRCALGVGLCLAGLASPGRSADPVEAPKPDFLATVPDDQAVWFTGATEGDAMLAMLRAADFGEHEERLEWSLYRTAERLDAYFTVEKAAIMTETIAPDRVRTTASWFDLLHVPAGEPESIEEWVRQLNGLRGIKAVRDAERPRVVHLIEKSLIKGKGYPLHGEAYPLERRVTGSYSGTLKNLPDRLGKLAPGVATDDWGGGFPAIGGDSETEVELTFEEQPVRDVLTDAVPLEGYTRMIWKAETNRWENDQLQTRVKFYGPKSSYETADPPAESDRPEP